MSTDTLSRFVGPADVGNGTTTVYTVPSSHTQTIKNIRIVNATSGSISIALGIGGVANANLVLPSTALGAGESCEFDGVLTLASGETVQASTSADGLTITISGMDQV